MKDEHLWKKIALTLQPQKFGWNSARESEICLYKHNIHTIHVWYIYHTFAIKINPMYVNIPYMDG